MVKSLKALKRGRKMRKRCKVLEVEIYEGEWIDSERVLKGSSSVMVVGLRRFGIEHRDAEYGFAVGFGVV